MGVKKRGGVILLQQCMCSLLNYIPSLHFKIPQCSAVNYDIRKREKANLKKIDHRK